MQNLNEKQKNNLVGINVLIHNKNGSPAVELRTMTQDPELIKLIIGNAYHRIPMLIIPQFRDLPQFLNSCIDKGILTIHEGQYYYTF